MSSFSYPTPVEELSSGMALAMPKPMSRDGLSGPGKLILIAEDNELNQRLIAQQLLLTGYVTDLTCNGVDAFKRWQSGDYALLLTDLHMPKMNGYQLTAAIRHAEQARTGEVHMPIIACTANSQKEEADRCIAMGMDDYLSKPFLLADLKAMLGKWLSVDVAEDISAESPIRSISKVTEALDVNVLRALIGNDETMIHEFLNNFLISAKHIAAELRTACAAGRATETGALAHKLKSAAYSVGALKLSAVCAEIERAGKGADLKALTALLPEFVEEMASVVYFFASTLDTGEVNGR